VNLPTRISARRARCQCAGDLRAELVLVGGCAASLLINAPTAPPPRVTYDVD